MASTPIMDVKTSFEEWWERKQTHQLFPVGMKPTLYLAFADGWHRANKAVIELADKELVE